MSLQVILEQILALGEAQIREIERNTRTQVNSILAQAQAQVHQIEGEASASTSASAIPERARILHRARLEALQIVGDVREGLIDTAIACARERLMSFRADPCYLEVLRRLTEEALDELASNGRVRFIADARDERVLKNILAEMKLEVPVSYELNCWGGLIAKSEDGRVVVTNTFEARLERATAFLRHDLAALFEAESQEADPPDFQETLNPGDLLHA